MLHCSAQTDDVSVVCGNLSLGDWFILIQVGNNIDSHLYRDHA